MKKSYWLYKMCLLLGLGICIPVTGNASDIGDATLTQQQSKITASGVVVDESGESLIGASVIEKGAWYYYRHRRSFLFIGCPQRYTGNQLCRLSKAGHSC